MSNEQTNQSRVNTQIVIPSQLLLSGQISSEKELVNIETGEFLDEQHEHINDICQDLFYNLNRVLSKFPFSFESDNWKEHIVMLPFPQETKSCFGEGEGIPIIVIVQKIKYNDNNEIPDTEVEYPISNAQHHIVRLADSLSTSFAEEIEINHLSRIMVGISPVLGGTDNNHIAGGGPGGLPVEPPEDVARMKEIHFAMVLPESEYESGEVPEVSIAVLDTAYDFKKCRPMNSSSECNSFEPNESWMNPKAFPNGIHGDVHMEDYKFKMKDHGLFVSSLAKASAPKGTSVKLYQILDNFGVGTGASMCRTFHQLAWDIVASNKKDKKMHWVINMSFFSVLTGSEHEAFEKVTLKLANSALKMSYLSTLTDIMGLLICALQSLETRNNRVIFVAAAGNSKAQVFIIHLEQLLQRLIPERKPNEPIFSAFAPARYSEVIAVAATDDKLATDRSIYSRDAVDLQDERKYGVQTFGGAVINGYANSKDGIVGLYYNKYPVVGKNIDNKKGIASWAGTSFATPLVSGAFARLLSSNKMNSDDPVLELHKVLTGDPTATRKPDLDKPVKLPLKED